MFDNPFYMVGDPGQCVDAIVQSPKYWKVSVMPTHTIHPRPAAMCEEQHEEEPTMTTKRPAAVAHPNAQQDAFPSFPLTGSAPIKFTHIRQVRHACGWFFPSMTKRTLIKTDKAHAFTFIFGQKRKGFVPCPKSCRFITSPIRKVGFRVLWGFKQKPNSVFDMFHVRPCFGVPTFFSMRGQFFAVGL